MAKTSRTDKVRAILNRVGDAGIDVMSVSAELGEERKVVEYTLVDLAKRGELIRTAPGRYRIAGAGETERVTAARARAFARAERDEQGSTARRTAAPSTTSTATVDIPKLTAIGRRRDGSIVCEDSAGDLWVASKLTGSKR